MEEKLEIWDQTDRYRIKGTGKESDRRERKGCWES